MITLSFDWSWFAFTMGALSVIALQFLGIVIVAAKQYKKSREANSLMYSDWVQTGTTKKSK